MNVSIETKEKTNRRKGINAALFSAVFLGLAPVFGKKAILLGLSPLGVVAFRTLFATILLFVVMLIFQRKYLFIYPAGLLGCLAAGWINGFGSLLYYSALDRIDAGVGQLLYSLYPLFVAIWLMLDHQPITRMTSFRLGLALPAVFLLIQTNGDIDIIGVLMMLGGALLYALHLPINQRVLYDIPAPTVTLYTLVAMSAVVVPVYLFSGTFNTFPESTEFWWPVLGLTLVTFFSRILLFAGVKRLGGMQTAMLGLSELLVTIVLAYLWLDESLSVSQWIGAGLLMVSMFLISAESAPPQRRKAGGWFSWISAPPVNTQEILKELEEERKQHEMEQKRSAS